MSWIWRLAGQCDQVVLEPTWCRLLDANYPLDPGAEVPTGKPLTLVIIRSVAPREWRYFVDANLDCRVMLIAQEREEPLHQLVIATSRLDGDGSVIHFDSGRRVAV